MSAATAFHVSEQEALNRRKVSKDGRRRDRGNEPSPSPRHWALSPASLPDCEPEKGTDKESR